MCEERKRANECILTTAPLFSAAATAKKKGAVDIVTGFPKEREARTVPGPYHFVPDYMDKHGRR